MKAATFLKDAENALVTALLQAFPSSEDDPKLSATKASLLHISADLGENARAVSIHYLRESMLSVIADQLAKLSVLHASMGPMQLISDPWGKPNLQNQSETLRLEATAFEQAAAKARERLAERLAQYSALGREQHAE